MSLKNNINLLIASMIIYEARDNITSWRSGHEQLMVREAASFMWWTLRPSNSEEIRLNIRDNVEWCLANLDYDPNEY